MTLTKYSGAYQELFEGCIAYWDGSLTTDGKLQDIIGGYHGTITSTGLTQTDRFGKVNKALYFDGSADYVNTSSFIPNYTNGTILFWFKNRCPCNSTNRYIGCQGNGSNLYPTCAFFRGTFLPADLAFWIRSSSGSGVMISSSTSGVLTGNWQLLCGSWGSNGVNLYVDGILIASNASTVYPATLTCPFQFGGFIQNVSNIRYYWGGDQGEALAYNRQLSTTEIKTLYDLTKSKYLYPVLPGQRSCE